MRNFFVTMFESWRSRRCPSWDYCIVDVTSCGLVISHLHV